MGPSAAFLVIVKSTTLSAVVPRRSSSREIHKRSAALVDRSWERTWHGSDPHKRQNENALRQALSGEKELESSLILNIPEHLNAEIARKTITTVSGASTWLMSTFLYKRIVQKPKHYEKHGLDRKSSPAMIQHFLKTSIYKELNGLGKFGMISRADEENIAPTKIGELMANYCISFDSMKKLSSICKNFSMSGMLKVMVACNEFLQETTLRHNEKVSCFYLSDLNMQLTWATAIQQKDLFEFSDPKGTKGKNKENVESRRIRFKLDTKVKTDADKVWTLIQVHFGNIKSLKDDGTPASLFTEAPKLMVPGVRLCKCLYEMALVGNKGYMTILNAITLYKCFKSGLWENSAFVTRQLQHIGPAYSSILVEKGLTSFDLIRQASPRMIEMYLNKQSTFVKNNILDPIKQLPVYAISFQARKKARFVDDNIQVRIMVKMVNYAQIAISNAFKAKMYHAVHLVAGDSEDNLVAYKRLTDAMLIKERGVYAKVVSVKKPRNGSCLTAHVISEEWSGIDVGRSLNLGEANDAGEQEGSEHWAQSMQSQSSGCQSKDEQGDEAETSSVFESPKAASVMRRWGEPGGGQRKRGGGQRKALVKEGTRPITTGMAMAPTGAGTTAGGFDYRQLPRFLQPPTPLFRATLPTVVETAEEDPFASSPTKRSKR